MRQILQNLKIGKDVTDFRVGDRIISNGPPKSVR